MFTLPLSFSLACVEMHVAYQVWVFIGGQLHTHVDTKTDACATDRQTHRHTHTHTPKVLLFDFVNEVYVWVGKQSSPVMRRKAIVLGKKIFEAGCRPPVFNLRSSPARQSGRYRPKSSTKSPRHSIVNSSGRRSSRVTKSDIKPRPEWALFAR